MRRFCPALASILLAWPALSLAGPQHVLQAPDEGSLRPHHRLELPTQSRRAPSQQALPPPPQREVSVQPGQIRIGSGDSLLAAQGTLSPSEAGYRPDVWHYLKREQAETLLAELNTPITMLPLRKRIVSLLLLKASPPYGATDRWLSMRLGALQQLDAGEEAAALLKAVPASLRDDMRPMALFRFFLASDQLDLACEALEGQPQPEGMEQGQWQRLSLFCAGVREEFSQVELALAIAEEQGSPYPGWLITLLEHFQYERKSLPKVKLGETALDQQLIEAVRVRANPPKAVKPTAKSFPQKPAYALLAIERLIQQEQLDDADDWLNMLDRREGDSAASFVAHELVRFLRGNQASARSAAAAALPLFAGLEEANEADARLLERFYRVMAAFDYQTPPLIQVWLQSRAVAEPGVASNIGMHAQTGNTAGYLFGLADWLHQKELKQIYDGPLLRRIAELRRLREDLLARQLAAESIAALWH